LRARISPLNGVIKKREIAAISADLWPAKVERTTLKTKWRWTRS
jgi:hypothetical protein